MLKQWALAIYQPFPAYRHCYAGLTEQACFNLAYYFTYRHRQPYDISAQTEQIKHLVSEWKAEHQRSDLFFVDKGDFLLFFDTRPNGTRVFRRIDEPLRTLYLLCDTMRSPRQLVKQAIETDFPLTETEIRCLLQPLLDFGLMVSCDKDKTFNAMGGNLNHRRLFTNARSMATNERTCR